MAFIGESTTTPTATTDASYYQKYLEEQKRLAALALQQNYNRANEGQSGYDPNANNWWKQLTNVPAKDAKITNLPGSAFAANTLNYLFGSQAPSGVSQAIGNTGYANWNPQSQFPAFAPMTATPGYMNPADTYAKRQAAYNQYLKNIYGYSDRYNDPFVESTFANNRFVNDGVARRYIDPGDNRYFNDPNISDYIVNFDENNYNNSGTGGYPKTEFPEWSFGGGGGGGRRSSGSGIGRSKQLASWYQAMTNWNINRPQSG